MKNLFIVLLVSCSFVNVTNTVSALSTVYVNNTYTNTTTEGKVLGVDVFRTIQEAVDAVDENGTIHVSTGVYNESVSITKSLTLSGSRPLVSVGAHPNAPVINGGDNVGTILIDGETHPVTVTIKNLMITRGKYGIAVLHNAKVTITKNTITNYAKNGITFGPVFMPNAGGIRGTISNNNIAGIGKTETLAQNGIQISEGNTAVISTNTITNNTHITTTKKWATGILIHESNGVAITNNTLIANQIGINLIQANASSVTGNTIRGDSESKAGIMVTNLDTDTTHSATGNTIRRNTLSGGFIGIWSSYAHGNKYLNNIISSTARDGIYLWNSSNNTLSNNTVSSVRSPSSSGYGIELDDEGSTINATGTKGSHYNILTNNTIIKSDSGFLLGKNSRNNTFSNNRFNGIITSPVETQE